MEKIILSLNADIAAQSLYGSVLEQLISVNRVIKLLAVQKQKNVKVLTNVHLK